MTMFVVPTTVGFFALFSNGNIGHTSVLFLYFSKLKHTLARRPLHPFCFLGNVRDLIAEAVAFQVFVGGFVGIGRVIFGGSIAAKKELGSKQRNAALAQNQALKTKIGDKFLTRVVGILYFVKNLHVAHLS